MQARSSCTAFFLSLALLALAVVDRAEGRSFGAAGCAGGRAAVGGLHLSNFRPIVTGPLSNFGLEVAINGEVLVEGGPPLEITAGEDHVVTLTATGGEFKGFLFRLDAPGVDIDLAPLSSNAFDAAACEFPVLGVTHGDPNLKSSASATMEVDVPTADGVTLDVTVVIANDFAVSEYYYSGFTIDVVDGGGPAPTTPAPTTPEPTTPAPTTPFPTMVFPTTTEEPTTPAPTTPFPTMVFPATPEPTTPAPTTSLPTMVFPATAEPTTPAPTTPAPTILLSNEVLCDNCQRLYKRLENRGVGKQSANSCNTKCDRMGQGTRNPKLYIPDSEIYCGGLCKALGNERKASNACSRKTPFCD